MRGDTCVGGAESFDVDIEVAYDDFNINVKPRVVNNSEMGGWMQYQGKVTGPESLGRMLQQARLVAGLTQRELANQLGTTQKYVWELEAGKPSIIMDRLFAAMQATGMELTATINVPSDVGAVQGEVDHRG
ncbi:helix-turn-helix domain-containing protein [Buchananella felis]|uniref:helix-turn-helix domain-containing protein n=1 Tax=Buchananella felis TaxID=3231492 RepID=UPI0035280579